MSSAQNPTPLSGAASNLAGKAPNESESGRGVSHATGDSKVPAAIQKAVPEKLEQVLPDALHDTSGTVKK